VKRPEIEALLERRLDDREIGRDVEVTRNEEAVVTDAEDFVVARIAVAGGAPLDVRQDRITHRLKELRDERRADRACRLAATQCEQAPAHRNTHRRRGQQVARKVDDVFEIVPIALAIERPLGDQRDLAVRKTDRAANARVQVRVQ
jgi:hypothetical protein